MDFDVVLDIFSDTTVTDVARTINLAAGSDGNIGNQIYIIADESGKKMYIVNGINFNNNK